MLNFYRMSQQVKKLNLNLISLYIFKKSERKRRNK